MSAIGGAREKELRLALVCYGGISLAVYMHGITKEIWHAASASRAFRDGSEPQSGSRAIYQGLLDEIANDAGLRLRILPDIVAGASAGGINGIFLARAIATGQSLDPLTDLWLESADVEALIGKSTAPRSRFSKAWALPIAWLAAGRGADSLDDLEEATREEVRSKLSHFVRSRWFEPPFSGEGLTGLLLNAFDAMAASPRGPRLLPNRQPIDLFVTVTDFGGHPERLRLHSPPEVVETEHRLIFAFCDRGGEAGMLASIPELTFAARATSSFPGAFPPFEVTELDRVLESRGTDWPTREAFLQRVLPRHFAADAAARAVLIDGSVLANAPFGPAIEALRERPARRSVDRRFIYIDPSPGTKFRLGHGSSGPPGFFQTIIGALSELPRQQPIRDNLEAIARRSNAIERMREVVEAIRPEVDARVEALFGRTLFLDRPTAARLVGWRRRAQIAAATNAGYGYAAYAHLKIAGVLDLVASLLLGATEDTSAEASRHVRDSVAEEFRGIVGNPPVRSGALSDASIDFLRRYDVAFRIRRLRLLARRLGELDALEAVLEPVRRLIFDSLSGYLDRKIADSHRGFADDVRALDGDAGSLLTRFAASLDLTRLDAETDARLAKALAGLPKEVRRPLLLDYLGFPFFDVATLPMLQGEGLDEFDPIKVDRIAPDDARSIRSGGAEATLKGIQFNSFGAFFSRAYRENDYLWGRLHGAERMIDIVISTLPGDRRLQPGRVAEIKRAAFTAILDEEQGRLSAVKPLFETLRREIG